MHVEMCAYWNGEHVYAAPNCPHGRTEDELGPIHPPGWTVQNARRIPSEHEQKEANHGR